MNLSRNIVNDLWPSNSQIVFHVDSPARMSEERKQ